MATGTFYLRPSADISLGHTVYPSTLTSGYLAINEEVSDGSSTYIDIDESTDSAVLSQFNLDGEKPVQITQITDATIVAVVISNDDGTLNNSVDYLISVNGNGINLHDTTNATVRAVQGVSVNESVSAVADAINSYISANGVGSFPSITMSMKGHVTTTSDSGKNTNYYSRTTQFYLAITCEYTPAGLNIHHKINGTWTQAQAAYQKVNGTWVEITEDECKNILQNNFLTSG